MILLIIVILFPKIATNLLHNTKNILISRCKQGKVNNSLLIVKNNYM
jgi:hypothetical protein